MPYNRVERKVAALLDAAPGLRAVAKAGYQRFNYLVHGGRREALRLHPSATVERAVEAGDDAIPARSGEECFYGYFGLQPWSGDGRRYLFHRWRARDGGRIAVCAREAASGSVQVLGESSAWNFQQGSMAQWIRHEGAECVIFNDAADGQLVCRIVAPDGVERRHPWPVQALHPGANEALSLNYRRLARIRPEYGYDVEVGNFSAEQPPERDGLWRVDLDSGTARLVVSLAELSALQPRADMGSAEHKVNHAVYSPAGTRFVFMHRWLGPNGKFSRLYVADSDGSGLRMLLDHRMVSHYAWRDERRLLVWARAPEHGDRYYLLDVTTGAREACCAGKLDRFGDGHPSFSPDGQWIVTDSYPDRGRMRRLLLCRPDDCVVIEAGAFHSPWRYDGPERCDLHPRWNRDGTRVSIDSSHEGVRWTYVVDVSRLVA
jgi:Tol biopolymer transport system component